MQGKVQFFLPRRTADSGTQTLLDTQKNKSSIHERLRESTIDLVLHQEPLPPTSSARGLLQNVKSSIGYYVTQLQDDRFDILTPPATLYSDMPVSFSFEFYETSFLILNAECSKSVAFDYERASLPLIEPLETGILTTALFAVLEKLQVSGYNDGSLLCLVTDFRYEPERVCRMRIAVGSEVVQFYCRKATSRMHADQQREVEAQALACIAPRVCTDPSPNVARAFSEMDSREKMWRYDGNVKRDLRVPTVDSSLQCHSTITLKKPTHEIKIPEVITTEINELRKGRGSV